MGDAKSNDLVFLFILLFPLIVDVVLAILLSFPLRGRKKLVFLSVLVYILLSFVLPIFLGLKYWPGQFSDQIALVAFVLLFRALELFGLKLGKIFLYAWLDKDQRE